mmetsp:Transcript_83811/g.270017  ORF Transcript_83811/g.270017 Transcript_83811/m.270017 type:complete len:216 (+) Transcript_83811:609-1256(+)
MQEAGLHRGPGHEVCPCTLPRLNHLDGALNISELLEQILVHVQQPVDCPVLFCKHFLGICQDSWQCDLRVGHVREVLLQTAVSLNECSFLSQQHRGFGRVHRGAARRARTQRRSLGHAQSCATCNLTAQECALRIRGRIAASAITGEAPPAEVQNSLVLTLRQVSLSQVADAQLLARSNRLQSDKRAASIGKIGAIHIGVATVVCAAGRGKQGAS